MCGLNVRRAHCLGATSKCGGVGSRLRIHRIVTLTLTIPMTSYMDIPEPKEDVKLQSVVETLEQLKKKGAQ